jgi:hypothetical protein
MQYGHLPTGVKPDEVHAEVVGRGWKVQLSQVAGWGI